MLDRDRRAGARRGAERVLRDRRPPRRRGGRRSSGAQRGASPLRYEIDGQDQFRIYDAIDEAGLDLGAIYHSHTRSDPCRRRPTSTWPFYPDALYLIVGVEAARRDDVRAWRIVDGQVSEASSSRSTRADVARRRSCARRAAPAGRRASASARAAARRSSRPGRAGRRGATRRRARARARSTRPTPRASRRARRDGAEPAGGRAAAGAAARGRRPVARAPLRAASTCRTSSPRARATCSCRAAATRRRARCSAARRRGAPPVARATRGVLALALVLVVVRGCCAGRARDRPRLPARRLDAVNAGAPQRRRHPRRPA